MRFLRTAGRAGAGLLFLLLTGAAVISGTEYAAGRASRRISDVAYVPASDPAFDPARHRLDVFVPKQPATRPRPVVIFIHGGSWQSGDKNFYAFIGRRLARQGYLAVTVSYRLAPKVLVPAMADDCARAVLWVQRHAGGYGGDSTRIFLLGHSAGGGLAALLATDDSLFLRRGQPRNPVRGAVLDDPGGLNMYTYLQKMEYEGDEEYLVPFGRDSAGWRQASPYYRLRAGQPRFLLFLGGKTYPSIWTAGHEFHQRLAQVGNPAELIVIPGRHHIPMVLQLWFDGNIIYQKLREFVTAS